MRMSDLTGKRLDYWVYALLHERHLAQLSGGTVPFSTDWRWGGPLLEKYEIVYDFYAYGVAARIGTGPRICGDTILEACMRALVHSVYGSDVDNPVSIE